MGRGKPAPAAEQLHPSAKAKFPYHVRCGPSLLSAPRLKEFLQDRSIGLRYCEILRFARRHGLLCFPGSLSMGRVDWGET